MNGRRNLYRYLNDFMAKFSSYTVVNKDNHEEHEILGYAFDDADEPEHFWPRFRSQPVRKPGELEYIRDNQAHIRRLIKKNALEPYVDDHLDPWGTLLTAFGISEPQEIQQTHHVRYEIDYQPTQDELEGIIEQWREEDADGDSKWIDVGVIMRGEQVPRWFGNSLARDKFDIEVQRANEEVVNSRSLLSELVRTRRRMLDLLD
ncbi:hypothetical protein D3260_07695 [Salinisphaera sp. Q1T1-3]|nr:hypothetical protein D3260_07695 [Salinisphaera sp. Q1T1-3]